MFDPNKMAQNPAGRQQVRVDIRQTRGLACEKCESQAFQQVVFVRVVSALLSPNGEEQTVNIPSLMCASCGHINDELNVAKQIDEAESD